MNIFKFTKFQEPGKNDYLPAMVILYVKRDVFFISSTPDVDQFFLQRLLHIRSHHADMAKVRVLQIYSVFTLEVTTNVI